MYVAHPSHMDAYGLPGRNDSCEKDLKMSIGFDNKELTPHTNLRGIVRSEFIFQQLTTMNGK